MMLQTNLSTLLLVVIVSIAATCIGLRNLVWFLDFVDLIHIQCQDSAPPHSLCIKKP
ncbi:hypothetical protein NIES4106_26860 [Fischerella sp. NIES-4106]|jgi:hypothetical protein|nr:hypothetical protein NIES4106_26860 [Fischerella sp. NIES-4106]